MFKVGIVSGGGSRLKGGLYFQNDPDVTEKMICNSDPAIQNPQFAEVQPKGGGAADSTSRPSIVDRDSRIPSINHGEAGPISAYFQPRYC